MIPNNLQQSPAYALNRAHAVFHEVLSHRRLLLRYVLLPLFIVTLLWSLLRYSISYSDSRGFPTDLFTHAYPQNPPTYPPKRPASWNAAAEEVKDAFVHAYEAYERFAAPHDELRPLSREHVDNFNGWGVTIYDSLDTMLLMNLTETFERAVQQVERADFWMQPGKRAPFFETTIRHVGGLLSAYAISGRPILLDKADTLARKLAPIFNTPVGLPQFSVNTVSGDLSDRETVCLAEIASFQLEYTYLSKASGKPEHFQHADSVWNTLYKADVSKLGGMLPTDWLLKDGSPHSDKLTIGAQGDSTHEYTLKQYILTGQTDKKLLEMYLRMTTQLITRMLWITPNRLIVWPSSTTGISPKSHRDRTFEHLACFLPGLLMLGVHTLPLDDLSSLGIDWKTLSADLNEDGKAAYDDLGKWRLSEVHRWAAESLGEACAVMYADQPTGLAPDKATMSAQSVLWFDTLKEWRKKGSKGPPPGVDRVKPVRTTSGGVKDAFESREYVIKRKAYQLRPETVESMFLLWRMTGQVRWRIHGWNMFRAIVASAKVPDSGFASVFDVGVWPPSLVDDMPSYFTAETLKYLYLLFSDEELVPLDRWVFNTEAHPLPVFTWTDEEKARLGIV